MAIQPRPKLGGIYCNHVEVFSHQVAPQPVRNSALRNRVEHVNKDEHAGRLHQADMLRCSYEIARPANC
jgi:hypothetical protein